MSPNLSHQEFLNKYYNIKEVEVSIAPANEDKKSRRSISKGKYFWFSQNLHGLFNFSCFEKYKIIG